MFLRILDRLEEILIATLMAPLRSVDLAGMNAAPAVIERSDVCAISAAAVVGALPSVAAGCVGAPAVLDAAASRAASAA